MAAGQDRRAVGRRQRLIHALHEQRPPGAGQARERAFRERPVEHLPAAAFPQHDARFEVFARGELDQPVTVEEIGILRQCFAHQQRFFLPVALHELAGRQAAEQGEGV